jgi:hypothetical protein
VVDVPEEFRLVTDAAGLSIQLTARGPEAELWVESVDLQRIVVRGAGETEFDYLVQGVRRGFGKTEPMRKNRSFVPEERGIPFGEHYPAELRRILVENGTLNPDFTPNEETAASMGWTLRDPDTKRSTPSRKGDVHSAAQGVTRQAPSSVDDEVVGSQPRPTARRRVEGPRSAQALVGPARPVSSAKEVEYFLVSESVGRGDVLVVDPESPDRLSLGSRSADATVVGIVMGGPGVRSGPEVESLAFADPGLSVRLERAWAAGDTTESQRVWLDIQEAFSHVYVPLALSGTAVCNVDAGYGAIEVGDLLTTSPTPGHAARAAVPVPGTIVGKALEPLDTGIGSIKVLVMLR